MQWWLVVLVVELRYPSVGMLDLPFGRTCNKTSVTTCVCWWHGLLVQRFAVYM